MKRNFQLAHGKLCHKNFFINSRFLLSVTALSFRDREATSSLCHRLFLNFNRYAVENTYSYLNASSVLIGYFGIYHDTLLFLCISIVS